MTSLLAPSYPKSHRHSFFIKMTFSAVCMCLCVCMCDSLRVAKEKRGDGIFKRNVKKHTHTNDTLHAACKGRIKNKEFKKI